MDDPAGGGKAKLRSPGPAGPNGDAPRCRTVRNDGNVRHLCAWPVWRSVESPRGFVMRTLLVLGMFLGLSPAAGGQDKLPSEQAQPIGLLAAAQYFPRAAKFLEQGKFEEALQVLRSFSDRDDLYRCDCYDAPHFHRSSER